MEQKNKNTENNKPRPLASEEVEQALDEISEGEQLYSIALFDILGFSQFVESHGTQAILELYNKLVEIVHRQESTPQGGSIFDGGAVPVFVSSDYRNNQLVCGAGGYVKVCHFSDTFIIYVHYLIKRPAFWLRTSYYEPHPLLPGEVGTMYNPLFYEEHPVYLSFLQTCMQFFCEAIEAGIPLRGCISTGMALMNDKKSIYFGRPLVEAARGESVQNSIGVAYGRSFNNYHPVYHDFYIPYEDHIKAGDARSEFLSPIALDWPRFWRRSKKYGGVSIKECLQKINVDPRYSSYYDNAVKFAEYSAANENWSDQIEWDGIGDIREFYKRAKRP